MAKNKNAQPETTNEASGQVLDSFEFGNGSAFGASKYDWDTILDGNCRKMVQGEHYTSKTSVFRLRIKQKAKLAGQTAKVATFAQLSKDQREQYGIEEGQEGLIVQAVAATK